MSSDNNILLHVCCAPCMSYVYEALSPHFNITAFFFNPNIFPPLEYDKRLGELRRFSTMKDFSLIVKGGLINEWSREISPLKLLGEGSERCFTCFYFRLEAAFKEALERNIRLVATTLSISPRKDIDMINRAGKKLAEQYGIDFYDVDFKKNDGYKKSVELSRIYGFYRQSYCGCIYSRIERNLISKSS